MSDDNAGPLGEITIEGELTDYGVEMARQLLAKAQRPAKTIVLKTPEGEYTLANGQAVAALEAELARVRAERDEARMVADKKHNMIMALIGLKDELRAENGRLRAQLALYQDDERGFKRLEGGGQQATFSDGPASEDYPGELCSDAPYKQQLRDGRGGWGPW
jgi:hypothetical protein